MTKLSLAGASGMTFYSVFVLQRVAGTVALKAETARPGSSQPPCAGVRGVGVLGSTGVRTLHSCMRTVSPQ